MASAGRRGAEFVLSDDERDQLVWWSRGSSRVAVRAAIVLRCAEPAVVYERVAAELGVTKMTVAKWRKRFAEERLDGLADGERPGRPKAELMLTDAERAQLTRWSRRAKSAQALALRARIVLACAEPGRSNKQVAADLRVAANTVDKWRARFVANASGWSGGRAAAGAATVDPAGQVEEVITATLEQTPANATHWSRASMAKKSGLSQIDASGGSGGDFELKPHRRRRVQAVHGSAVRRQGRRRGRAVPQPAGNGPWCCAWTRRARCRPWTALSR